VHAWGSQIPIDMGALSVDSFVLGIHLMYWVSTCGVFGRLGFMLVLSQFKMTEGMLWAGCYVGL
jgi:hypothetical protein